VGEDHDPPGFLRHGQVAGQAYRADAGLDFLTPARRVSGARGGRGAGSCRGLRRGCALEAGDDLLIGHLGEPGVELADGEESCWRGDGDHLVGIGAGPFLPAGRRDGHGEDHPRHPERPGDLGGGPGGGPGGDAVVDHHRDPPVQRLARPPAPVARSAGVHLGLLPRLDRRELVLRYPGPVDDLGVDDPHPVLPDRAHAQLGLERHPELTHHDDIQRRAKRAGHLRRDQDAAPWQAQDNDRLAPQVPQTGGKTPPRIITIGENHDNPS
jgi:hypothetical protein